MSSLLTLMKAVPFSGRRCPTDCCAFANAAPNVADHILNNQIQLIVNTPLGRESFFDDRVVRRVAMLHNIPCITTLTGASAAVEAIRALRDQALDVRALQDYHAEMAGKG